VVAKLPSRGPASKLAAKLAPTILGKAAGMDRAVAGRVRRGLPGWCGLARAVQGPATWAMDDGLPMSKKFNAVRRRMPW